jgi:HCOMODA/2-hydroxy-3-carboxy-muconic semialdehyde decarboxylase
MTDLEATAARDLVLANRILAREDVLDAFGHVSVRHPDDPARFLIARSLSPAQVTAADLQVLDLDGRRVGGDDRASYAEVAIHAAVYRHRPDVRAVCHSHAAPVIPFTVTRAPLRPITHVAAVTGGDVPTWDSADLGPDLLVRTAAQGDALARTLGMGVAALMRGHGCVVAAADVRALTLIAIRLVANAEQLAAALALGDVRYLSPEEIVRSSAAILAPLSLDRAWRYWVSRVEG